jgi:hypothetical protein
MGLPHVPQLLYRTLAILQGDRILTIKLGLLINCNIATYLTGSALIPLGLTWWQAFICIVLGNLIATLAVVLNSLPGAHYHGSLHSALDYAKHY